MSAKLRSILILLLLAWNLTGAEKTMRVLFLQPHEAEVPNFWTDVTGAMQAASRQLGIRLDIETSAPWQGDRPARLRQRLRGPDRPDYLITTIHKGIGTREMEVAEAERVPFFIINTGLLASDQKRAGEPRQHFKYWLGQMLPDEAVAGRILAQSLLRKARERHSGPLRVLGLGGRETDWAAQERNRGLREAVAAMPGVVLEQIVPANYDPGIVRIKTPRILRRYPETKLIWAASDQMALAAAEALKQNGKRPGEDLLLGGINWVPQALEALQQGQIAASVGGHFLEGAFALVLLFDHHRGHDFARERCTWRTRMECLTQTNIPEFQRAFSHREWHRLNFRSLSRALCPALTHYDFSILPFLRQRP